MITKYGEVIIGENDILITRFEFDCKKDDKPFDVLGWAKKRLNGKTSIEIDKEKK